MSFNSPEFSSLDLLEEFIRQYEFENCVRLWKRDSRTIEKMKKVCPLKLKTCNPELKYYSITYACKKGGRQFKSESSGLRQSSTYKNNCPMAIKFVLNNDGSKLRIVHILENHNHPVNRELSKNTRTTVNVATSLPGPHISVAMSTMEGNLSDESVTPNQCGKSRDCHKNKNITVEGVGTENGRGSGDVKTINPKEHLLTAKQKYKLAQSKCDQIASIISNFNMNDFRTHCDQLDSIINLWSQGPQTIIAQGQIIVTVCNEQEESNKTQHSEIKNELQQDIENCDIKVEQDDTEMGEILGY